MNGHEQAAHLPGVVGQAGQLLQAITRGLEDVADVEPWTTTFNPGRSTLDRLVELSQEVDFAAFVFAQDDWTTIDASQTGQASPRDNVVFEAGLFGGALGIRRTFILHANGSKLPSDLLGLTSVRYDPATSPAEVRAISRSSARRSRPRDAAADRGAVVAALADHADRGGTVGGEPPAYLAGPRRRAERERPCLAGRRDALGPPLERGRERAQRTPPASSTSGRASDLGTRTPPNSKGLVRSEWRRRPRHRLLDDKVGSRSRVQCPNCRRLPSCRPRRPPGAGCRERGGTSELIARRLREWKAAANAY